MEASTPFAEAVDNPGSHPTATPAPVPSREYFITALSVDTKTAEVLVREVSLRCGNKDRDSETARSAAA